MTLKVDDTGQKYSPEKLWFTFLITLQHNRVSETRIAQIIRNQPDNNRHDGVAQDNSQDHEFMKRK